MTAFLVGLTFLAFLVPAVGIGVALGRAYVETDTRPIAQRMLRLREQVKAAKRAERARRREVRLASQPLPGVVHGLTYPARCLWRGSVGALLRMVPR